MVETPAPSKSERNYKCDNCLYRTQKPLCQLRREQEKGGNMVIQELTDLMNDKHENVTVTSVATGERIVLNAHLLGKMLYKVEDITANEQLNLIINESAFTDIKNHYGL